MPENRDTEGQFKPGMRLSFDRVPPTLKWVEDAIDFSDEPETVLEWLGRLR